jgi:hypothetical protein
MALVEGSFTMTEVGGQSPRGGAFRVQLSGIIAACQALLLGAAQAQEPQTALEEIVVTAQFRTQSVQDTPIAISAMSGDALARRNAMDIADASNFAPNVALSRGAGGFGQMAGIFIRGVGQADPHFAVEPGVGVYVDDVYSRLSPGAPCTMSANVGDAEIEVPATVGVRRSVVERGSGRNEPRGRVLLREPVWPTVCAVLRRDWATRVAARMVCDLAARAVTADGATLMRRRRWPRIRRCRA